MIAMASASVTASSSRFSRRTRLIERIVPVLSRQRAKSRCCPLLPAPESRCFARVRGLMDASIFKAYDVRGLYGEQIDGEVAYRVGRAFARVLGAEESKAPSDLRIGLGRDMRLTAPEMAGRYADGMRDEGADVLDVGMVGTEMLYFAVGSRDLDGG